MNRNKTRSEDKIQNGGDRKFCRVTSCRVMQPLASGILGVIGCFVAIIGTAVVYTAVLFCVFKGMVLGKKEQNKQQQQ